MPLSEGSRTLSHGFSMNCRLTRGLRLTQRWSFGSGFSDFALSAVLFADTDVSENNTASIFSAVCEFRDLAVFTQIPMFSHTDCMGLCERAAFLTKPFSTSHVKRALFEPTFPIGSVRFLFGLSERFHITEPIPQPTYSLKVETACSSETSWKYTSHSRKLQSEHLITCSQIKRTS
jgi:hypothetical protein